MRVSVLVSKLAGKQAKTNQTQTKSLQWPIGLLDGETARVKLMFLDGPTNKFPYDGYARHSAIFTITWCCNKQYTFSSKYDRIAFRSAGCLRIVCGSLGRWSVGWRGRLHVTCGSSADLLRMLHASLAACAREGRGQTKGS